MITPSRPRGQLCPVVWRGQVFFRRIAAGVVLWGAGLGMAAEPANTMPSGLSPSQWQIQPSIELGGQFVSERQLFWGLSAVTDPHAGFNPDRYWWEFYAKPALALTYTVEDSSNALYVRLSAVGSGTLRRDAFDTGNTGRLSLEESVVGIRWALPGNTTQVDLSVGAQTYTLGTGMLIANGASNGFARGAMKLGPRKAFGQTAIARANSGAWTTEAFYLDPNENPDNNSHTRLAGANLVYRAAADRYAGLAYGQVVRSDAAYPQAAVGGIGAPTILPAAREGLRFVYGYGRMPILEGTVPGAWLGVDLAQQWNANFPMRAWGGRAELGFELPTWRWQPQFTLGYQAFSGDNPNTSRQERFDPLYYAGSPGDWATGSKSSMVFINTNVNALQAAVALHFTPQDTLTLYVAHVRANQLRSPLQFGQATRLDYSDGAPAVVAGVTSPHLSNDFFAKYTRVVNRNTYLTAGVSASVPGAGMDRLLGGKAPLWTGWFVNLVLAY